MKSSQQPTVQCMFCEFTTKMVQFGINVFSVVILCTIAIASKGEIWDEDPLYLEEEEFYDEEEEDLEQCACGFENIVGRIMEGEKFSRAKYPWLVLIRTYKNGDYYRCSGTLIDAQHIVTAAHCMLQDAEVVRPDQVQVFVGAHSLHRLPLPLAAGKIFVDPSYNISSHDWTGRDLAIITLIRRVRFNKFVWPICISGEDLVPRLLENPDLVVAGWGQTEDGIPILPREGHVLYVSAERCFERRQEYTLKSSGLDENKAKLVSKVPESDICAINDHLGTDICDGDSGSPLMYKNPDNNLWYFVGVASRGRECPHRGTLKPGMYTSVDFYLESLEIIAPEACIVSI